MLHTKTTSPEMTSNWQYKCPSKGSSSKSSCSVGIPSTEILGTGTTLASADKNDNAAATAVYKSNCFLHSRVKELVPMLEEAMQTLHKQ
jgi:hypothetical protein